MSYLLETVLLEILKTTFARKFWTLEYLSLFRHHYIHHLQLTFSAWNQDTETRHCRVDTVVISLCLHYLIDFTLHGNVT